MLNVPVQIQALFKTDGVRKNFRVHFPNGEHADLTNSDIVAESVRFTESVCSKEVFQFGLSERSKIEFECVNVPNIYGVTIECGIEIDTSSLSSADISAIQSNQGEGVLVLQSASDIGYGFYRIPYGVFVVESCPRSHGAMSHRRVVGYSFHTDNSAGLRRLLSHEMPVSKFMMTSEALRALTDESIMTSSTLTPQTSSVILNLYDICNSAGTPCTIQIGGITTTGWLSLVFSHNYSYLKAQYNTDMAKYSAVGLAVAELLDNAGLKYYYSDTGAQIYASNEEMLRKRAGYLFEPSVHMSALIPSANYSFNSDVSWLPVVSGELTPIIGAGYPGGFPEAYKQGADEFRWYSNYVEWLLNEPSSLQVKIFNNNGTLLNTLTYSGTLPAFTCSPSFTGYEVPTGGDVLAIDSTLTIPNGVTLFRVMNSQGTLVKQRRRNGYTYANAVSIERLTDGQYEMLGAFRASGRTGSGKTIFLSKSNPIAIGSSEVNELWWDEYNIAPLGEIVFKYGDPANVYSYAFGSGASRYDMQDNYMLAHVYGDANKVVPNITTELDTNFIPNSADIAFTPVEATVMGLPYLEAGDYLEIDDADGGTVETYALQQEITGIQTLFATITSNGGEIIGEG